MHSFTNLSDMSALSEQLFSSYIGAFVISCSTSAPWIRSLDCLWGLKLLEIANKNYQRGDVSHKVIILFYGSLLDPWFQTSIIGVQITYRVAVCQAAAPDSYDDSFLPIFLSWVELIEAIMNPWRFRCGVPSGGSQSVTDGVIKLHDRVTQAAAEELRAGDHHPR